MKLPGQLTQKLALVHAVFEGFAPLDENDRDLVVELPAQFVIGIDIHFLPGERALAGEFCQAFFHDFAKMAALARVNHDLLED